MKRKLAAFGFAFALAELLAAVLPVPALQAAPAFLLALPPLVLAGVLLCFCRRLRRLPVWAGLLLGIGWHLLFTAWFVAPLQAWDGQNVNCTVTVQTDAEASYREGYMRGTLAVEEVNGRPADFSVYCSAFPFAEVGDRFTAVLALQALPQDDFRLVRYAKNVFLAAEYREGFAYLGPAPNLRFALFRLRARLSAALRTYLSWEEGTLAAALLLADKANLSQQTEDSFRTAGVSHLLAVSGLHVALLCVILMGGAAMARSRRFYRPAILAQSAALVFYMLLTGCPLSVLRAGIAFLLTELGCFFLQPPDALTSLGACAVLLSLPNAYLPCDIGVQLSFCAVLGVLAASALLRREQAALHRPDAGDAEAEDSRNAEKGAGGSLLRQIRKREIDAVAWLQKAAFSLLAAVQTAALAGLATLPVLVWHRMTVSGVGVLTNLLVTWALSPALLAGLWLLVLSLLPPLAPAAHLLGWGLSVWLYGMRRIVAWCAALPMAKLSLPTGYTLFVLAVLAALGLLFWKNRALRWFVPAGLGCAILAVALGTTLSRGVVRVALVGNAASPCAVAVRDGRAVVFFRGGAANQRAVKTYLSNLGQVEETLLVDLRPDPRSLRFAADEVFAMDAMTDFAEEKTVLQGLTLDCYHTGSANLAVLDVAGYHIGISSGSLHLAAPLKLDLYLAGGTLPKDLSPAALLTTEQAPKWWQQAAGARRMIAVGTPVVTLRPGHSVQFEEVTDYALQ